MNPLDPSLGTAIRSARDRRDLTQAELASRCGISRRHLAAIEGGANFSVAVLGAIAAELEELAAVVASWLRRNHRRKAETKAREAAARAHKRTGSAGPSS